MSKDRPTDRGPRAEARFMTTHWSVVFAAGHDSCPQHKQALDTLCGAYWFPLYAYLRRTGCTSDEAADLTQAFFAQLLEKDYLKDVRPEPGKFRSFLLACLRHFVANQRKHDRAAKRGGRRRPISLDLEDAESRYALEPVEHLSPERLYEKSWALAVIRHVMHRLDEEMAAKGKSRLLDRLAAYLTADAAVPYRDAAADLNMTESAVKVAVHRLRKRCRQLLRDEIAQTVSASDDIDDEIRVLFTTLSD